MHDLTLDPCPVADPPLDASGRCALCNERVHDVSRGRLADAARLAGAGACGRLLRDRTGALLFATWVLALGAEAGAGTVRIEVTDADTGQPVPVAVLRPPDARERTRLDPVSGAWEGEGVDTVDGFVPFERGRSVALEISAPGYESQQIVILGRRRDQRVQVALEVISFDLDDDLDDPVIEFGGMRPRSYRGGLRVGAPVPAGPVAVAAADEAP